MVPQQRSLILIHSLVILATILLATGLLSQGHSILNLWRYPIDGVAFCVLVLLAVISAWLTVRWVHQGRPLLAGLWLVGYYLLAFGIMMDGSVAGWAHSNGLIEKLAVSMLYIALAIFSLILPVAMLALSTLQILSLRWWFRRQAKRAFRFVD